MLLKITTQMTTSLIQSYLVSIPEKGQALNGTSIPMRILFSKSMVTNKSLEVGLYWSGKADKCVLSRRLT